MALTTDVAPRIHLTPVQVLQDEDRMKRLKAALCDGVFAYAEEQVATRIVDDCLKVCGGSAETLSEVLQTKFFVQHTPFYWIITNRPQTKPGAPPLLVRLVSVCDELNQETSEEIVEFLCAKYESGVYSAVKSKLTGVPTHDAFNPSSFFQDTSDQPVITAPSDADVNGATFSFRIPKFFDRLSVDGEVWFAFPHLYFNSLVRVQACLEVKDERSTQLHCNFKVHTTFGKYSDRAWRWGHAQLHVRLQLTPSQSQDITMDSALRKLDPGASGKEYGSPHSSLSTNMTLGELFLRLNPPPVNGRGLRGTIQLFI